MFQAAWPLRAGLLFSGGSGMNILILGGFLGSGKTTCLMQLAKYLVRISPAEKENKVMILENEIGQVGIDDEFLRSGGFRVDNLFSGCACCTVSGEMVTAAIRIRKNYDPQWLVVETTGLAYPGRIQENLVEAMGMKARVVVLVDAKRWPRIRKPMEALLKGQIVNSDAVVINKIDLVTPEAVELVKEQVREMDAGTGIFTLCALNDDNDAVWKAVAGE